MSYYVTGKQHVSPEKVTTVLGLLRTDRQYLNSDFSKKSTVNTQPLIIHFSFDLVNLISRLYKPSITKTTEKIVFIKLNPTNYYLYQISLLSNRLVSLRPVVYTATLGIIVLCGLSEIYKNENKEGHCDVEKSPLSSDNPYLETDWQRNRTFDRRFLLPTKGFSTKNYLINCRERIDKSFHKKDVYQKEVYQTYENFVFYNNRFYLIINTISVVVVFSTCTSAVVKVLGLVVKQGCYSSITLKSTQVGYFNFSGVIVKNLKDGFSPLPKNLMLSTIRLIS